MSGTQLVDRIVVQGNSLASTSGTLAYGGTTIPCALGRGGLSESKIEGDGASPIGQWPLRRILYRADRLTGIRSCLLIRPLTPDRGWCDAPADTHYNCEVALPYPASTEQLWRGDEIYDVIVILGYNDAPVVPGKGSAIFLHIARPEYSPTQGCVAVSLTHMQTLLSVCSHQTVLEITL